MNKHIVFLPGWGLGVVPLHSLAETLDELLPDYTVQVQPLPNMQGQTAAAVIELLDQQLPKDSWLVGWSLGGMLASVLAAHRQSTCAGLISYASNARFVAAENWPDAMPEATFAEFYELCGDDLPAGLKRFSVLCSQGAAQPRALSRQLLDMTVLNDKDRALAGLSVLAELDTRPAIRSFAGPQLHLLAKNDALMPSTTFNKLAELNPQATVELLGQSHASVFAEPQLLAQRMQSFILSHCYA